jgi:hypothetical protein
VKSRIAAAVVILLVAAACGREGGPSSLPQKARFCKLADRLSDEAVVALASVGVGTPLAERAQKLESFIYAHRAVYAELDRNAPPEIRPALLRQRAAQRAFFSATDVGAQKEALAATANNGSLIRAYELRECPKP